MDSKRCTGCRETLPVDQFYPDTSRKDGLAIYCKECKRRKSKESQYKSTPHYTRRWVDSTMFDISPNDY